jgi:polyadenylate-binding protein 2
MSGTNDDSIEEIKKKLAELEEEAKLIEHAGAQESEPASGSFDRGICIKNVDFSTTEDELRALLGTCGDVVRITIGMDHFTKKPKGYAYVEMKDQQGYLNALVLDNTKFKDRVIHVEPKRENIAGYNARGRGRGGNFRSRGRGGGGNYQARGAGGRFLSPRGRGGGRRGRGYSPYHS